jgi:signal transduction histidine kinase
VIIRPHDILYVLNSQGKFIFIEGDLEVLVGYSPVEFLGRHFTSIIYPSDIEAARRHFHERRTGDRATRRYQVRLRTKRDKRVHPDIGYRTMELDAFGMWDNASPSMDKRFHGTFGVARDAAGGVNMEGKLVSLYERMSLQPDRRKTAEMLLDILEKEKERIAAELHDHISQKLLALRMDLEFMGVKETTSPDKLKEDIKAAEGKAAQIMKDLRSSIYGLRPAPLDVFGLRHCLDSLFEEISTRTDLKIQFFTREVPERFDPLKELALFRIAQEALTNVIRHARAQEVHVNLIKKSGDLFLSVEDDGIGFDVRSISTSTLGLLLMRERTAQFDGSFSIDSTQGRGTHILAEIPLERKMDSERARSEIDDSRDWERTGKMEGYVSIHKIGDRQIYANVKKFRIYARLHGFISEGFFHQGQSALDATLALLSSGNPPFIDYVFDMRFSEGFPRDTFRLWKDKTFETLEKYPQVYVVGIADEDSPLWLQVSQWKELFEKHGDRVLGIFESLEKAEAFLDELRKTKPS